MRTSLRNAILSRLGRSPFIIFCVEESSKIDGWEGTAGPALAGALQAEPVASRSDAEVHPGHMPFTGSHSRASHYGQEGRFRKAKQARSFCSI